MRIEARGTVVVNLHFAPGKLVVKSTPTTVAAGATVQVPLTVADGRGTGTAGRCAHRRRWMTAIMVRCASNSTCTLPKVTSDPSGTLVLAAAKGTGMGIMNLVAPLSAAKRAVLSFTVS
jgi:hypothetical protein